MLLPYAPSFVFLTTGNYWIQRKYVKDLTRKSDVILTSVVICPYYNTTNLCEKEVMIDRKINERAEKPDHKGLVAHQKCKADAEAAN